MQNRFETMQRTWNQYTRNRRLERSDLADGWGLRGLLASLVLLSATMVQGADDEFQGGLDPQTGAWQILIRPRSYNTLDEWAYTRTHSRLMGNTAAVAPTRNVLPTAPIREPVLEPEKPAVAIEPTLVNLGYSVRGIPIVLHVFGQAPEPTFIFGAIHGSEGNSGELARQLIDHLHEHPTAYQDRCVAIIAAANPDGFARNTRTNLNSVDLNRNFPAKNWKPSEKGRYFGGTDPGSEPETQALIRAVDMLAPACIVTIHAITRGRHGNNYDGPAAGLAELMKTRNGYPVMKTIGYPTPGSFGSWAGVDRQIPTITLELPHDLSGDGSWAENREALLAVIQQGAATTGQ